MINGDLMDPPPSIGLGRVDFAPMMRADCALSHDDGWRQAMVAFNRLLAYVEKLERRVSELESTALDN